jgi:hypothetical protein
MNGSSTTNALASSSLPISHQPASRLLPTPDPSKWPRPRSVIGGHRDPVGHIAWNLDGKKLASGSVGEKGLRIWDVSSSGDNVSQLFPPSSERTEVMVLTRSRTRTLIEACSFCPCEPARPTPFSSALISPHDDHLRPPIQPILRTRTRFHLWQVIRTDLLLGRPLYALPFFPVLASIASYSSSMLIPSHNPKSSVSTSKPTTLLQPTSAAYRMTHHPEGRVLATSDFKEQVTFYDHRMLEVAKPLAETSMDVDGASAGEDRAVKEPESKPEWKESETKYANDVSGTPPVRLYSLSMEPSSSVSCKRC